MQTMRKLALLALATVTAAETEFKFVACGRGEAQGNCGEGLLKVQSVDQPNELRCCSDEQKSGWIKNSGCSVWAESKELDEAPMGVTTRVNNNDHHGCVHGATYAEAEQICADKGAYVCTKEQVLSGCTRGSGCSHNNDLVWTSSPANPSDVARFQARQRQASAIRDVCTGPTGRVWGDPHFITFDNLKYDCQGQGEFVIAMAMGDDPLAIHGRFVRRFAPPSTKTKPTVTGSVAVKVLDAVPPIQVTVPDQKVNGKCPLSFTYGTAETPVPGNDIVSFLENNYGGAASAFTSDKYVIFTFEESGTRVQVTAGGSNRCVLNTDLCLTPGNHGGNDKIVGLLGTPTGTVNDDWYNLNGTTTTIPALPGYCVTKQFKDMTRSEKRACKGPVNRQGHDWCMANWCIGNSANSLWSPATHSQYNQCGDTAPDDFFDNVADIDPLVEAACALTDNPEECETDTVAEVEDGGDLDTFVDALKDEEDCSKIVENLDDVSKIEELLCEVTGPVPEVQDGAVIEIVVPDNLPDFVPEDETNFGTPQNNPAGSNGDPHFKTWRGEHFEYHGQCDMVLAKDEKFADGLGMEVQIRTKLVRFWSYIKTASIMIGNDILQIEGSADSDDHDYHYWINFEYQAQVDTIGGFPLTVSRSGFKKTFYEIDLSSKFPGQKIVLSTFREFVAVDFQGSTAESFGNVVGMLGDFTTGDTLARDGATVIDDFAVLGNEWQVLPSDPKLFQEMSSEPQFPRRCIVPEDPRGERRRRLDESTISVEVAEATCSKALKNPLDIKDCVYDILATQDLDMVGAF